MENESHSPIPLIAVAGPTASGKSRLAVELAKKFDGEVISCDSMQVYRGMDIGTAKATAEERGGIPHHMLDVADPHAPEPYSCAAYVKMATEVIREVYSRGRLPILCGGTGMYLDGVLTGTHYAEAVRVDGFAEAKSNEDNDTLWNELRQIDPEAAAAIHPNNRRRVLRAMEIFAATGMTKTAWDRASRRSIDEKYRLFAIGLRYADQDTLKKRIDRRVEQMLQDGLEEEVRRLNLPRGSTAAQAIGYKEMLDYIDGNCSREAAAERIRIATRQYAKRQMTWFRAKTYLHWYTLYEAETGEKSSQFIFKKIVNDAEKVLTNI